MSEKIDEYHRLFGEYITTWKMAENFLGKLLLEYTGHNAATYILSAELTSKSVIQALASFANDLSGDETKEWVLYAIKLFEHVREYRNYYVHGIRAVVTEDGEAYGLIDTASAKAGFAHTEDRISYDQLAEVRSWTGDLIGFLAMLMVNLEFNRSGQSDQQPPPPPKKPPLPRRLVKPRQFPLRVDHPSA